MKLFKKGFSFTHLTVCFLTSLVLIFTSLLFISRQIQNSYKSMSESIMISDICKRSSQTIKDISNNLSEKAQYFVITHSTYYAEEYLQERFHNNAKEEALAKLFEVSSQSNTFQTRLKIAFAQADSLATIELYAIRLAYEAAGIKEMPKEISKIEIRAADISDDPAVKQKVAQNVLFNEGYGIYRQRVNQNCTEIIQDIENSVQETLELKADKLASLLKISGFLQALVVILSTGFFIYLILMILRPLKSYSLSIKNEEHLDVLGALELKNLAETYNHVHDFDELTKILNRRGLNAACRESEKKHSDVCFILVDVDNFKHINDTYGHSTGDFILESLAKLLVKNFRPDDAVARIGGDEFAVLCDGMSTESTELVVSKIAEINSELSALPNLKDISVSVGIAFSRSGYSKSLFSNADKALYRVKNGAKHGSSVYESVII